MANRSTFNFQAPSSRMSMMPSSTATAQGGSGQVKARQLAILSSQLTHLTHNLANTDELVRLTAVQAEHMRVLGSWHGGMFMAVSKVLGEESVREAGSK